MTKDDDKKPTAPLPEPSPVEFGGRVELRLVRTSDEPDALALYAARWFTSDLTLEGQVSVGDAGTSVKLDAPSDLPQWLGTFTTTLVRTTARTAAKDSSWPRRLTRWRKAPDSGGESE